MRTRALHLLTIAAAAFTGLLGAHALDYSILARDPLVRARLLAASGHAWLSRAPEFAIASVLVALIAAFALGFRHQRGRSRGLSRALTTLVLALVQGGAFVALEAGERIAANAGSQRLLQVTFLGVGLQVLTAAIASVVIATAARFGSFVARAFGCETAPRHPHAVAVAPVGRIYSRFSGARLLSRGPPSTIG